MSREIKDSTTKEAPQEGPENTRVEQRPELTLLEGEQDGNSQEETAVIAEPDVSQEIAAIREELGIEQKETIEDEDARRLEEVVDFLGLRTKEVFGREQALQILPELDKEKLETLHNVVELTEQKYELREQLRVFSEIFDLSVEEMRDVIDTTSAWTEDHSTRLTILTCKLADKMWPFDGEFKKSIWQAGLLHDVGKVATPKSLLDKDGPLSTERKDGKESEKDIVNRHPKDGEQLLSNLARHNPFIADGTKHHEKWGGGGYSYGLRGNEIPFVSQVLSVADVYDAMSSERPYKQGRSPEKCIQIIEEMSEPRQALDNRGEPVIDDKTGQPVIITEHFSKLPVAYLKTLYENRELSARDYFDVGEGEQEIVSDLEQVNPYSVKENALERSRDREDVARLMSKTLERFAVVAPEDLKRYINDVDAAAIKESSNELQGKVAKLAESREALQEVYVDALFLLVKSVDARYRAYHEGSDMNRLAGGQERTENVVRYSLMLAQQMGLPLEEQKKVAMAAMFCDIGILGIDEEKIRNNQTLGVTSFEEFKKVPEIGYRLLKKFTDRRGTAPYFTGAEVGAAEAHLWADGKGGYGVRLNQDGEPSTIGRIVAIAYKYVAMRADNPYRGKGLDQNPAMEIMRQGVGTEFDPKVWERWEALYAWDVLRVFKERPEVVSYIKDLFKGKERPIVLSSPERGKIVEYANAILAAEDREAKMRLCFEAARYAHYISRFDVMERFLELAEPIALEKGNEEIVSLMERLYDYDLKQAERQKLERMRCRLKDSEIIKAIGAVESLVIDFAEKGQSITPRLAEQIRSEVIPAYKDFVLRKVEDYRSHTLSWDKDALSKDVEFLEKGLQRIGDDSFSAKVQREMEKIRQTGMVQELKHYINFISEFADDKNDPFNGEHFVAVAEGLFKKLTPQNQKALIVSLENARRSLYRRGYSLAFERLQEEAEEGNVHIVLELEKRVKRWMGEAQEKGIQDREFAEERTRACARGVEKMRSHLQSEDLNLEDAPRIDRWVKNVADWQTELPASNQLGREELDTLQHKALERVRDNMIPQIREVIDRGEQAELKRLVMMVSEYIVESNSLMLRTHELNGMMTIVRDKLFEAFVADVNKKVQAGEADKVASDIHYFHRFCGGDGRGEIIGLTERQRETLENMRREVYVRSLNQRVANIERFGAETRLSRLEQELEKLQEDKDILEGMGERVDDKMFALKLNEAVYKSLSHKISESVSNGDFFTLGMAIEKLDRLIKDGKIEHDAAAWSAIRELAAPFIREHLPKLAEEGSLEEFELSERTLQVVSGDEFAELRGEIASYKHTCYRNYVKRVSIQLKIYGIESYIGPMRQEEDKLRKIKEIAPDLVDDSIFEYSQREAERIVNLYQQGINSYAMLGSIVTDSVAGTIESMKKKIAALQDSVSGREDSYKFRALLF